MPVMRRLSTLAVIAAIFVLGVPLMRQYFRRGPTGGNVARSRITLVSPRGDLPAVQAVPLVWRSVASTEQYEVSVVGDDGSSVLRETTRDTMLLVRSTLVSGRDYSWSVVAHLADGDERRSEPLKFRITAP